MIPIWTVVRVLSFTQILMATPTRTRTIQVCSVKYPLLCHNNNDCDDSDEFTFPGAALNDDVSACMTDADEDDWGDVNPVVGLFLALIAMTLDSVFLGRQTIPRRNRQRL